jgi:hypothetical protein
MRQGRIFFSAFCFLTVVAVSPSYSGSGEMSSNPSSTEMEQSYSMLIDLARAHIEEALHAAGDGNLDKVGSHSEIALSNAKRAEGKFETYKVSADARKRFDDGIKNLEELRKVIKKLDRKEIFDRLGKTRVSWLPWVEPPPPPPNPPEPPPCHGDGCLLNANGTCKNPGMTGCDSFKPWKRCTNAYGGCYCL